jgi:hypothetical protein
MAQSARLDELGAAELLALKRQSLLDNSERHFRSRTDGLALVLGDGREYMDRELVGVRHVGGNELDAGVHKRRNERDIAAEPVELGDDELGLVLLKPSAQPVHHCREWVLRLGKELFRNVR